MQQKPSMVVDMVIEAVIGAIAFAAVAAFREGWEAVPQYAAIGAVVGALIGVGKRYFDNRAQKRKK